MLHTHPKVLIWGKYQKTSTQCGNPKSAILSSYLHKLGCKDSKVLDCANQLHILHKEKMHPNLTKLFPLYSVLSHKGKKTLTLTLKDLKKYQLLKSSNILSFFCHNDFKQFLFLFFVNRKALPKNPSIVWCQIACFIMLMPNCPLLTLGAKLSGCQIVLQLHINNIFCCSLKSEQNLTGIDINGWHPGGV